MKNFITNRKGQKVCVEVKPIENSKGLAFVMHGLSGNKEQDHVKAIAKAFSDNNFSVVLFDTTNTFGESDGKFEDATITNYYKDFEDVINWAKSQPWYQEPFALSGHSLGGFGVAWYAEQHPEEVSLVAPISPFVSGKLSEEAHLKFEPNKFKQWKESGWREDVSSTRPDIVKKLPWSHMEDRMRYDLIPMADKLIMPSLLVVGDNDTSTPLDSVQKFYDKIPSPKLLHVIKNAPHTFRAENDLKELTSTISQFVKNQEQANE